jgi:hypothetical protein
MSGSHLKPVLARPYPFDLQNGRISCRGLAIGSDESKQTRWVYKFIVIPSHDNRYQDIQKREREREREKEREMLMINVSDTCTCMCKHEHK